MSTQSNLLHLVTIIISHETFKATSTVRYVNLHSSKCKSIKNPLRCYYNYLVPYFYIKLRHDKRHEIVEIIKLRYTVRNMGFEMTTLANNCTQMLGIQPWVVLVWSDSNFVGFQWHGLALVVCPWDTQLKPSTYRCICIMTIFFLNTTRYQTMCLCYSLTVDILVLSVCRWRHSLDDIDMQTLSSTL